MLGNRSRVLSQKDFTFFTTILLLHNSQVHLSSGVSSATVSTDQKYKSTFLYLNRAQSVDCRRDDIDGQHRHHEEHGRVPTRVIVELSPHGVVEVVAQIIRQSKLLLAHHAVIYPGPIAC